MRACRAAAQRWRYGIAVFSLAVAVALSITALRSAPVLAASSSDSDAAMSGAAPTSSPSTELGDSIRKPRSASETAGVRKSGDTAGRRTPGAVVASPGPAESAAAPDMRVRKTVENAAHKVRAGVSGAKPAAQADQASKKSAAKRNDPFSALQLSGGHGPIDIKSDKLELDYKSNVVTFVGHVRAIQSGAQLTSNSLKVIYGKDFHQVKQMFADGNVRMSQGTRWATGDHAVVNQLAHTVVLTGNPVVHDGEDQITGTRITVHLDTGKSEVEGARAVFFPKQQETRDNKEVSAR